MKPKMFVDDSMQSKLMMVTAQGYQAKKTLLESILGLSSTAYSFSKFLDYAFCSCSLIIYFVVYVTAEIGCISFRVMTEFIY